MTPKALTDMIREAMRARMIANRTTFARAEAMGPPGTLGSGYVVHKALPPSELDDVLQDIAAGVALAVTFSNAVGDDVPITFVYPESGRPIGFTNEEYYSAARVYAPDGTIAKDRYPGVPDADLLRDGEVVIGVDYNSLRIHECTNDETCPVCHAGVKPEDIDDRE